ncbi:Clavaminate synthase-like protein [Rhizopogon vinicolor AM-OR11-026]|uniref:Clavaminate synthase-like protein n=1 Tax=Rhizopogon vinicolor AM-OR11-026 TaxID=1314800 RepID=A0A1B7MVR8_9AGAM|nr:Clavaminate synthase-like protein [Rhizopogon vinicolor AM-OR11-026]
MPDIVFPIIDFARFEDETSPARTIHDVNLFDINIDALFWYTGSNRDRKAEVDSMFEWSFLLTNVSLPNKAKTLAAHLKETWKHRGYTRFGQEQFPQEKFDTSELAAIRKPNAVPQESFDIGRDNSPRVSNVWLPSFRDAASAFFDTCRQFELEKLLPALSLGLWLPCVGEFLGNIHGKGGNQIRLPHYPATPAETFASGERNRLGGHTRGNRTSEHAQSCFNFQNDVGGLEVESPSDSGNFVPAPPIPGTIAFNAADLLTHLSNGTLKSALHRVRAPPNDGTGMISTPKSALPT